MSEKNCSSNCSTCGADCPSRGAPQDFREPPHEKSRVKKVIGIVSGKGGVGKSMTSAMLATVMQRRGHKAAVLDADITGPSIPRLFGLRGHAVSNGETILPFTTKTGIDVMSINFLLQNETDPVVWRGPVVAGVIKQFWQEVLWQDVDFMFVDMPPGTGDVPLTVFQTLPVDGIVVVTTPQEVVGMVVQKALNMARLMNIPVLGIVENMAYLPCPDCGKEIELFGKSHTAELCTGFGVPLLARVPIDPALASVADKGVIELFEGDWLEPAADAVEALA